MSEESKILNSLVAGYLSKVSPGIAKQFKVGYYIIEFVRF